MIILITQVEVTKENCTLNSRHKQDYKHKEKESKHIVQMMPPDTCKDEKKLNEDTSKRKNSPQQHRHGCARV
eukprot:m.95975 g.95975  ORF g.95975 m.95975 type:complete len:72 (+) comp12449_c0_seq2:578-793(+)